MVTSPLDDKEKNVLLTQLKRDEQSIFSKVLVLTLGVIMIIFLPNRGGGPSLYQEYGLLWPFIILYTSMSIALIIWTYRTQKGIKDDLQKGVKFVRPFLILRQEKSYAKKLWYIWLEAEEKEFQKITFSLDTASSIEKPEYLIIEYAPKSKIIISQYFQVENT